ncbi:MAG TPA: TolC family protein, partial [Vicingus sp.]|nr:TolC family protein [Vicingus sp.]
VENTKKQAELASKVYQQILLQQKQGTANLTEVLMADNVLRDAQQQYLSSIIEYLKADLELKKLTGNFKTITN